MVKPECSGITVAKDNMKTTEDIWVECHNKLYSFIRSQVHVKGSECRFFDTNMSFVIRGLLFVAVGVGFFITNYVMLKKQKARENQLLKK